MATGREFQCGRCKSRTGLVGRFFEVLRDYANGVRPTCGTCGNPYRLRLTFPFGVGAGPQTFLTDGCYLTESPPSWQDSDGNLVEFYPFLLVVHRELDNIKNIWLPYWHVVYRAGKVETKYGQWAPFMNLATFRQLVTKAKADGHLLDL